MLKPLDRDSPVPLEEQIYRLIRQAIASGGLTCAQPLLSARELACDLGVHSNTVARAYRRLGAEGLLRVRHGRRACVREQDKPLTPTACAAHESVQQKLREVIAEAQLGGLSRTQLRHLFVEQEAAFGRAPGGASTFVALPRRLPRRR